MKFIIRVLMSLVFLFFFGCHPYEHSNPIDPDNPNVQKGTALFIITSYSLTDDTPGIFTGDKVLTVSIKNIGSGIAEGELVGYLSSIDSVSYLPMYYNKCSFVHEGTGSEYPADIVTGDVMTGYFRIGVSAQKERPFQINFQLKIEDLNNNSYMDSLQVTVPE